MNEQVLSIEEGGRAIASLSYKITYSKHIEGECVVVSRIFVAPDHRNKGHGKSLLNDLAAKEPYPIYAQVHHANKDAIGFFEKCGFTVEGEYSQITLMEFK